MGILMEQKLARLLRLARETTTHRLHCDMVVANLKWRLTNIGAFAPPERDT